MKTDWSGILNLLESAPADLVYHLVVGLALLLIFTVALMHRKETHRSQPQKHLLVGSSVLLSLQLILFVLSQGFIASSLISSSAPGLIESIIHTLTVLWLIWTFAEHDDNFLITGISILICLALLLWGLVSLGLVLIQPAFAPVENGWLFTIWDLASLALVVLGIAFLGMKRPQGWAIGWVIFLTFSVAFGLQIFLDSPGAFRHGPIRLSQTLTLPWAIVLLQRVRDPGKGKPSLHPPDKRADITPLLVDALLSISHLENPNEKNQAIARALSLSLVADMVYLVELETPGKEVKLLAGYDLIREQPLPAAVLLPWESLPNILGAWENFQPYAPNHPPVETRDAATLTETLNYHRIGNVLAVPLQMHDQNLQGGVIFLSPYTDKGWGDSALNLMDNIHRTLAVAVFEPDWTEKLKSELAATRNLAEQHKIKAKALAQSLTSSNEMLADQEAQIKQLKARYQIEKLEMVKKIEACQNEVNCLSSQAASQEQALSNLTELKERIRTLKDERDRLERDLARAKAQIASLEALPRADASPVGASRNEVLSLDAIAANTKLAFGPRCENKGVDLAIANPDGHQLIKTNPVHLQTLINSLMENALLASKPEKGSLKFQLKLSFETGLLEIQVTDTGEGLSPQEQQALFSSEEIKTPPAGIGSPKALKEAVQRVQMLDGKIWLRSKPGEFTSFRVKLPVRIMD
jgi:signal transduction histidine kinase